MTQMSIDEGVELEASETGSGYDETPSRPQTRPPTATGLTGAKMVSFSSSSEATSFDSTVDSSDVLATTNVVGRSTPSWVFTTSGESLASAASAVQSSPPWVFTSGESLSSAGGLESASANQDVPTDNLASLGESTPAGMSAAGNYPVQPIERCYLAVPGQSNMLQVRDPNNWQLIIVINFS